MPWQPGEANLRAKLTPEKVRAIRALKGKKKGIRIAKQFDISPGHVSRILRGTRWQWLPST